MTRGLPRLPFRKRSRDSQRMCTSAAGENMQLFAAGFRSTHSLCDHHTAALHAVKQKTWPALKVLWCQLWAQGCVSDQLSQWCARFCGAGFGLDSSCTSRKRQPKPYLLQHSQESSTRFTSGHRMSYSPHPCTAAPQKYVIQRCGHRMVFEVQIRAEDKAKVENVGIAMSFAPSPIHVIHHHLYGIPTIKN